MNSFKHAGDLGDIIYAMPTIKALGGGNLYLNRGKTRVEMNREQCDFIAPLLEDQPYIQKVDLFTGQAVSYDLNDFRTCWQNHAAKEYSVTLGEWHCRAFNVPISVLDEPWIKVPDALPKPVDVIIHRSQRYHNGWFPWKQVVEKYKIRSGFVGLKSEHEKFVEEFGYIPFLPVKNALEMAGYIAQCKLFIGNQSFPAAVAEGLKRPKILECIAVDPNCCYPRADAQYQFTKYVHLPDLPMKVNYKGMFDLYVDPDDSDMGHIFMGGHPYEPHVVEHFDARGKTFLDVGANIGFFTMLAISQGARKVISIEPNPENVKLITLSAGPHSHVIPVAASDAFKMLRLNSQGSNGELDEKNGAIVVPCLPMGFLFDEQIDVVKFDVEGHEMHAVMGMLEGIKKQRPIIFTEFYRRLLLKQGSDPMEYLNLWFHELGYRVFVLDKTTLESRPCATPGDVIALYEELAQTTSEYLAYLDLMLLP